MVDTFQPKYTYTKRGVYYFSKSVPTDLRHHYFKPRIIQSLRTKSSSQARYVSQKLASRLDDYWINLRLREVEIPAAHLLRSIPSQNINSLLPTIDDALDLYLRVKGEHKKNTFFTHSKRTVGYLKECLGSRPLDQYSTADAATFRDWLRKKGLSAASVQRNFSSLKAMVNFAIQELGLDCRNAFVGVYLASDEVLTKRQPLSKNQIRHLQQTCYQIDDDIRWLVALISDTGMRLAEAAGLKIEDLKLDHQPPHITLIPYSHRTLKTKSSERVIPLVGSSLWAAKRIKESSVNEFCFARYSNEEVCNSNSASAALNKWIKTIAGKDAVIHGLRHSFRDRLREVEAPSELIDQLGGWSLQIVGQSYGNGYAIENMSKWLEKIVL
jgi:integrase